MLFCRDFFAVSDRFYIATLVPPFSLRNQSSWTKFSFPCADAESDGSASWCFLCLSCLHSWTLFLRPVCCRLLMLGPLATGDSHPETHPPPCAAPHPSRLWASIFFCPRSLAYPEFVAGYCFCRSLLSVSVAVSWSCHCVLFY